MSDFQEKNPFEDPSVQRFTNTNNVESGLDYNPFEEHNHQTSSTVRGASNPPQYSNSNPAQLPIVQSQDVPPIYNKSAQQHQPPDQVLVSTSELQRRQEELDRKELDLNQKEQQLFYNARRNNWPPLPEKFCVQPCFYQDIEVEISPEFQKTVRLLYNLWMFHSCVLVLNILGGLALLIEFQEFSTFGLSILYLILFTPFSFICWFRPAYKAFRSDSSFNFMVFFFVFFFQFLVTLIQAIGLPGSGTCGIVTAIGCFNKSAVAVGIIVLLIAVGFGSAAAADILLLTRIHAIYRSSDASFAKAQAEFTSGILRNPHVQNAASESVRAHLSSTMSSGGAPSSASPRY